jgi:hypothetical protein
MNATKTRTRKTEERTAKLMQLGASQVLALTCGKDTVFYKLETLDHGFGEAAFRLSKADRGDGPGEVYDVLMDGARSSCECKGFLQWHHCKHVESLESLIAAGKLPSCKKQPERKVNAGCINCHHSYEACNCTI